MPHPVAALAAHPVVAVNRVAKVADSKKPVVRKAANQVAAHPVVAVNRVAKVADSKKPVVRKAANQVAAHPVVAVNRAAKVADSKKPVVRKAAKQVVKAAHPRAISKAAGANPKPVVSPVVLEGQGVPAALVAQAERVSPKRAVFNLVASKSMHLAVVRVRGKAVVVSKSPAPAKAVEQLALVRLAVKPTAKVVRASPSSP